MGGSYRVEQTRQEINGRGAWTVIGTAVGAIILLTPLVWIVVELNRVTEVVKDSPIVWVYATTLVLIVATGVWFLFRLLRQNRQKIE